MARAANVKPRKRVGDKGAGSKPRKGAPSVGNTATFPYLDSKAVKKYCGKEKERIEEACKPEDDNAKAQRHAKRSGPLSKLKLPKHTGTGSGGTAWLGDHCDFLMFKPGSADDLFKEMSELPAKAAEQLGMKALEAVEQKAIDALERAVKKKLAKMALKQGFIRVASFLGGPVVGIAVNVAMTADAARDLANAIHEFPELKKEIENARRAIDTATQKVKEMESLLDRYKDPKTGALKRDALVSDAMEGAARTNDCVTARRCQLVPFNQTGHAAALNGKGCCPGQTGHHLLPEAMFDHCKNYGTSQHSNAPTMCVEGANNSLGSHGKAHKSLLGVLSKDHKKVPFGGAMTKTDAIDAGVESVRHTFPESKCSEACLKAQLKDFYDKLNCRPKKESGIAGNPVGSEGDKI